MDEKSLIENAQTSLGIEFGSTRIKAVLIAPDGEVLGIGTHDWENSQIDGHWTYSNEEILSGLQACYANLKQDVYDRAGIVLKRVGALGVSAMMHGYLAFDAQNNLLVPFRTWRDTTTREAAKKLSELFSFHIPERWSVAHLYQAILDQEFHVDKVAHITTLAGYVSRLLTGENVLSIGDASGMFPINDVARSYDSDMLQKFDSLPEVAALGIKLENLLPHIMVAGEVAGHLSEEGARLLDASGDLQAGAPVAPAEGDAGTGMIATNSVAPNTGNISAGTSIFSMIVLDKELSEGARMQLDMVTTPAGDPVAMVHCNNCSSDLNAWLSLFQDVAGRLGHEIDSGSLYTTLFKAALEGKKDGGDLTASPLLSGEPLLDVQVGHPLFVRSAHASFDAATFMRVQLMSAFAALKIGNDVMRGENVAIKKLYAHGGLFKTPQVAQSILAAAMNAPVTVLNTASEGGAWGQALAAEFMRQKLEAKEHNDSQREAATDSLAAWLEDTIFCDLSGETLEPFTEDVQGYETFIERFKAVNQLEQLAERVYPE